MTFRAATAALVVLLTASSAAPDVAEVSEHADSGSGRARWVALARAIDRAAADPGAAHGDLGRALQDLERENRRWRQEQADSERRALPPAALERRARARAAYAAGQGRLLEILRTLVQAPPQTDTPHGPLLAEADELVGRLEQASRPQPISTHPRVFAPGLRPPALSTHTAPNDPAGAPPLETDAGSGPTAIPKELRDAAAQLEGPAAVYDWVRGRIRPEFYYGRMKGALQTYFDQGGNDADTAAVLVAMLRAKDVPARYVRGTAELPAAVLVEATGTATVEQAVRVLERAAIPHQTVEGGGGIASVKVERVWVEAYVPYANYRGLALDAQGKTWVPLDAGWKALERPRGIDVVGELGFDPRLSFDQYLAGARTATPLATVRGEVTALLAAQRPETTYAQALNSRSHVDQPLGLLPSSLPYAVMARHDVGYDLPESLEHVVRVSGETAEGPLFDLEMPLSQLVGRRLTLSYVPATDDDRAVVALYGGIHNTPPYLFDVRPVLKSDGVAIAGGESGIGMAVAYTLRLEVRVPAGSVSVANRVLAGNLTAIGLAGRGLAEAPPPGGETAAQILDSLARAYFRRWNESDEELANLLRVAPVRPTVSACLVSSDIEVDHAGGDPQFPIRFEWKGILVDADLRASAPVALSRATPGAERDFLLLSGLEGSVLEDRIFSDGLDIAAVSTASAIGQAAAEGITVHRLTGEEAEIIVPGLPLDPAVKAEVLDGTARGLVALLPAAEVTNRAWTGVGYVLLDEDTGEAAWQLQGGHSGGVTAPPVIEFPAEIVDPLEEQGEEPPPAPPGAEVAQIVKFGSTDFQFGTVDKVLDSPLKVLVTDAEGRLVAEGQVKFRVLGGGALLLDPITRDPKPEVTVRSDEHGVAQAALRLGQKTDLIPRYVLYEGDEFSTQVGMNLVAVSSGAVTMADPFMAFAVPDDQFDGTNRHATLTNRSTSFFHGPLGAGGLISIDVADPFGNPLSNIPVQLAYRPLPVQMPLPPGHSWIRGPTTKPLHLLSEPAYRACADVTPSVVWGECPGEAEALVLRSSVLGVFAHPIFGDSMGSDYTVVAGTEANPASLEMKYSTWGDTCVSSSGVRCTTFFTRPITWTIHGTRTVLANRLGNMIEAYPLLGAGDATFYVDAMIERERVIREVLGDGSVRFRAEGLNEWRREHLTDSVLRLRPLTPGTAVDPEVAPHIGQGRYSSQMIMGETPQLNIIESESRSYPPELKYLFNEYLDPAYVTDGNPPTVERVKDTEKPHVFRHSFALWGADAELKDLDPSPVLLSAEQLVRRSSSVTAEIRPPQWAALLDPRFVVFDVLRLKEDGSEQAVLSASGAEPGGFRVPQGLPVPPGDYTGRLTVHGTRLDDRNIESSRLPVPVCGVVELPDREIEVVLTRDPDNDVTCGEGPTFIFRLCWDAKVTIRVAGEVLTAKLDDEAPDPIEERTLSAGVHTVELTQDLLGLAADMRKPFSIEATALEDPALNDRADGVLVNQVRNRSVTRTGRTFVKGVDLLDGHVVRSSVDFTLPGRHLGLEVSRTYTSFGASNEGAMGAGWSWTYGGGLFVSDCGLVTVVTPGGESQVFRTTDNHISYTPQKGYHTRLVRNDDLSYDFFDKAGNRHHFREPVDEEHISPSRRLEYIEEPHGDRIVLIYNLENLLTRVAEVHPEAGEVRGLELAYEVKAGSKRIKSITVPGLGIDVRYEHDLFGNLVGAVRSGENVGGHLPAAPRAESYRYTIGNDLDRHQMRSYTGPNGEHVEYVFLKDADTFLGEETDALLQRKQEYAKEVREAPGSSAAATTRFEWDYRDASSLRYRTTVRDARGNPTTYVMNGHGSPLEIQEPLNRTTRAEWSPADILKTSETDGGGRLTTYGYDGRGNLTSEVIHASDFGGVETRYEYDPAFNKLTFKRDGEGRVSRWEIDAVTGDLLSMTDAAGNTTHYVYDLHGRLTMETSPRGHVTTHTVHDTFGHPRFSHEPLGNLTQRTHDARGRLNTQTDGLGHHAQTAWDGLDRPRAVTRISGGPGSDDETTETEYYPGGQVRRTTNANGAVTTFVLDGLNRVTGSHTTVPGSQPVVATTSYDGNGNPEVQTDRRGVKRRNVHDALNRLRRVEVVSGPDAGPMGEVATFEYDDAGNKTSETGVAGLRTDFQYDGLYRLKRRLLPASGESGRYVEETLRDRVGNVRTSRDANGHATQFTYDPLNRLIRTVNAEGHVATVSYDDPEGAHVNKSEEHDQTRGLRRSFVYDALNRETRQTVALEGAGSGESYVTETQYADADHSLTVKDARGTFTKKHLDGLDRVVEEVVDAGGGNLNLRTLISYDGLGNRKAVRDPRGRTTQFQFDGLGRLVGTVDAAGKVSRATYDGEGLKTSETDRRGVEKRFTHDNLRRPRRTDVFPRGELSGVPWSQETRYLDRDRKRIEIDARGKQTVLDLDGLDRAVELTDPRGKDSFTRWDGVNKRAETDKRGHTTLFQYDRINRLTLTRDPGPFQQQTLETTYADAENKRTDKDRRGIVTVTQTDPLGRVLTVTRAGIALETHTYDALGNRLTSRDAEGKQTHFVYDPASRLESRTDGVGTPEAAKTEFENDENGNHTRELDKRAADLGRPYSISRSFDALNRLETQTDGEGHTTHFAYDSEGNRTRVEEPLGQVTSFEYDELGKLTRVIQPIPREGQPTPVTSYVYDESRNRTRQTDANDHVVEMVYDDLNRLETMTQDPGGLGLVTRYEYDDNGNQTVVHDPKRQTVTSEYDELNRLKSVSYAFAAGDSYRPWRHLTSKSYVYDGNANIREITEFVASGSDPPVSQVTLRDYDDFDRLSSETSPLPDGGTRTVGYTYWLNGARKTLTDPAGQVTSYTYDGQNRLDTATTAAGITEYGYWPDDLLRTVTTPNGVIATHGYDLADRLLSITNAHGPTPISSYGYGYDANGNRLSQTEVNGGLTESTSYTYDGLNRLETVRYPADTTFPAGRVVTYGYDAAGNRTAETVRTPQGALLAQKQGVFDNVNRLTALNDLVDPAQTVAFAYDPNGNQTRKTVGSTSTDYRYDIRDRLVEVGQAESILSRFQYDCDGRRTKKIGEEGIRQYVYDQTSLLLEYDENGLPKAKYDYGSDRLLSLTRADEGRRFFSFDGLRSVTNLTDDAGSPVASYHLDAWGNFRFPSELLASKNRFAFTGYIWDKETSLFFAKARFYDPEVGRFTSQDSFLGQLDQPPSLHRYVYSWNRPTFWTDRSGHAPGDWWDVGGVDWKVFASEFTERATNVVTLGGSGRVQEAVESGRINAQSSRWDVLGVHAEGVLGTLTFGASDRAADAYAGEGQSSGSAIWQGTVTGAKNLGGAQQWGVLTSQHTNVWEKAEAGSSLVAQYAGLTAGGLTLAKGNPVPTRANHGVNLLAPKPGGIAFVPEEATAAVTVVESPTQVPAAHTGFDRYVAAEQQISKVPMTLAEADDALRMNAAMADLRSRSAGVPRTHGRFGTQTHGDFESTNVPLDQATLAAGSPVSFGIEEFRLASPSSGVAGPVVPRHAAGSRGVDAVVYVNGIPVRGFDLKTGRPWTAAELKEIERRFGVTVTQIRTK